MITVRRGVSIRRVFTVEPSDLNQWLLSSAAITLWNDHHGEGFRMPAITGGASRHGPAYGNRPCTWAHHCHPTGLRQWPQTTRSGRSGHHSAIAASGGKRPLGHAYGVARMHLSGLPNVALTADVPHALN